MFYIGGDVITAIGGQRVDTLTDYYSALEDKKPGETVMVEILRGNNRLELELTLAERSRS